MWVDDDCYLGVGSLAPFLTLLRQPNIFLPCDFITTACLWDQEGNQR